MLQRRKRQTSSQRSSQSPPRDQKRRAYPAEDQRAAYRVPDLSVAQVSGVSAADGESRRHVPRSPFGPEHVVSFLLACHIVNASLLGPVLLDGVSWGFPSIDEARSRHDSDRPLRS
jgi:hypothetical protein